MGKQSKAKQEPPEPIEEVDGLDVETHVRASVEIRRMLSWVWWCEKESGQSIAQIHDALIRPQLGKRYGSYLERIKVIATAMGIPFESGKVPRSPLEGFATECPVSIQFRNSRG